MRSLILFCILSYNWNSNDTATNMQKKNLRFFRAASSWQWLWIITFRYTNLGRCSPGFKWILYVLELSVVELAKDKSNLHSFRVHHILYHPKTILHNHSHAMIYLEIIYCPIMPHTHEVITPAIPLKITWGQILGLN